MATACWALIVAKSFGQQVRNRGIPPGSTGPQGAVINNLSTDLKGCGGRYSRLRDCSQSHGASTALRRHRTDLSTADLACCWHAKPRWRPGFPDNHRGQAAAWTHLLGRMTAYRAHSPRRTSTLTGRLRSILASTASNCRTSATCTLASARITSPARSPAASAGPSTS